MANLLRFTPKVLRQMRDDSESSLFLFETALWGDEDLTIDFHLPITLTLQSGEWKRLLMCMFRGSLKSSLMRAFVVWAGLFEKFVDPGEDFTCFYVMNKYENAKAFNKKIQDKFRYSKNAGLLQDLFSDPKIHPANPRIPSGFDGWNADQTTLVKRDPNSDTFFRFAGLDSAMESVHVSFLGCDDLEGADADKSDVPNDESRHFITQRAEYLLKKRDRDRIAVAGTPHGNDPLVHHLKELPGWTKIWKPIVKEDGSPQWPERASAAYIETQRARSRLSSEYRRGFEMQDLLLKRSSGQQEFDMQRIGANSYEIRGHMIGYPRMEFQDPNPENGWEVIGEAGYGWINVGHCNRFIHLDPLHRDPKDRRSPTPSSDRPSRWGIVVVAVSPDFHVFPVEEWIPENGTFDEAMATFFRFYRKWRPKAITYEAIGAQAWFLNHLRILEQTKYHGRLFSYSMTWDPSIVRLPAPSSRLVESWKKNQEKEKWIIEQLELPHNVGWLHLNRARTPELFQEHEDFGVTLDAIDGLDALAQGPEVWVAPPSPQRIHEIRFKEALKDRLRETDRYTGYRRSFNEEAA